MLPREILPVMNDKDTKPFYERVVDHNGDPQTTCTMGACDSDLAKAFSDQSDLTIWALGDVLTRVVQLYNQLKSHNVIYLDYKLENIGVRTDKTLLFLDLDSLYLFRDEDWFRIGIPNRGDRNMVHDGIRAARLHHTLINTFSGCKGFREDELDHQLYEKRYHDEDEKEVNFIFRFNANAQVVFVLACCCCALTAKPHQNGNWPRTAKFTELRDKLSDYNTLFHHTTQTEPEARYKTFKPFMETLECFITLVAAHLDQKISVEVQQYITDINAQYTAFVKIINKDDRSKYKIAKCFAAFTDLTL
tara:strand:- start:166 stop:1077 length:912 start_codon:yes stop_codon:yes gene_type:complete